MLRQHQPHINTVGSNRRGTGTGANQLLVGAPCSAAVAAPLAKEEPLLRPQPGLHPRPSSAALGSVNPAPALVLELPRLQPCLTAAPADEIQFRAGLRGFLTCVLPPRLHLSDLGCATGTPSPHGLFLLSLMCKCLYSSREIPVSLLSGAGGSHP